MLQHILEKCFIPHRTGRQVDSGYCDAALEYTMLSNCDTFHRLLFQNAESSPVITHSLPLNEFTCTQILLKQHTNLLIQQLLPQDECTGFSAKKVPVRGSRFLLLFALCNSPLVFLALPQPGRRREDAEKTYMIN